MLSLLIVIVSIAIDTVVDLRASLCLGLYPGTYLRYCSASYRTISFSSCSLLLLIGAIMTKSGPDGLLIGSLMSSGVACSLEGACATV